jgi:hypothetical protein
MVWTTGCVSGFAAPRQRRPGAPGTGGREGYRCQCPDGAAGVEPYRQKLLAEAHATVRFEMGPGRELQIDFGERLVEIAGRKVKVFSIVATLGYLRRLHMRTFRRERHESWFDGMESAFLAFGGVPDTAHLAGVAGLDGQPVCAAPALLGDPEPLPVLLRPLAD